MVHFTACSHENYTTVSCFWTIQATTVNREDSSFYENGSANEFMKAARRSTFCPSNWTGFASFLSQKTKELESTCALTDFVHCSITYVSFVKDVPKKAREVNTCTQPELVQVSVSFQVHT